MYFENFITSTNTSTTLKNKICYKTSTWKAESEYEDKLELAQEKLQLRILMLGTLNVMVVLLHS